MTPHHLGCEPDCRTWHLGVGGTPHWVAMWACGGPCAALPNLNTMAVSGRASFGRAGVEVGAGLQPAACSLPRAASPGRVVSCCYPSRISRCLVGSLVIDMGQACWDGRCCCSGPFPRLLLFLCPAAALSCCSCWHVLCVGPLSCLLDGLRPLQAGLQLVSGPSLPSVDVVWAS